jgi:hypothetical protein
MNYTEEPTGVAYMAAIFRAAWAAFWPRRVVLLAIIGAVTVGTAVIVWRLPQQWDARVTVRIGQIGGHGPVESPQMMTSRVETPGFKFELLRKLGMKLTERDPASALLVKNLKAATVGGTGLVQLSVRAYSKAEAVSQLKAAIELLQARESAVMDATTNTLRSRLRAIEKYAGGLEDLQAELVRSAAERLKSNDVTRTERAEAYLSTALVRSLIRELTAQALQLREERITIEHQLSPTETYSTQALEPVYVDPMPASPHRVLSVVLAFALTTLTAMTWAMFAMLGGKQDPTS